MRLLLVLGLVGCHFGASTKILGTDSGAVDLDGGSGDEGANDDTASDSGEPDAPDERDDDGDGYTENEGDCDDEDASIHPEVEDTCDGVDEDCDDLVDEDARDEFEPNDFATEDHDLGEMGSGDVDLSAYLHSEDDIDRYVFSVDDSWWESNRILVSLGAIGEGFTYKMVLTDLTSAEVVDEVFNTGGDDGVEIMLGDRWTGADTGEYRIVISSLGGAACTEPYRLSLELKGLLD